MNRFFKILVIGLLVLTGALFINHSSNLEPPTNSNVIPVYTYKVINTYTHDRSAFTEGLVFEDGLLYEGTGLHGHSTLRRVKLETGDILQIRELPAQFFGEGVTIYGNKIIQLTWQSHIGFVYDKYSFKLLKKFNYPDEGWGITHNGKHLIMSDGTETLHFLDPETFEEVSQIDISANNIPVTRINELEYIQGEIYANIWQTERIARIDPLTGQVVGWVDLKGILSPEDHSETVDVLNGIAYDAKNNRLFVTGKFWPKLFEIELIEQGTAVEIQVALTDEKDYDLLISKATAYAFRGIQPSDDELMSAEAAYQSLEKEKDKVAEWIYSTLQTNMKKTTMAYGYLLWRFGPDYVKGLEPSVLKSSQENTRLNGVYILGAGNKYHKSIVDLTINVLRRDPSAKVKAEAIHSLNALRAADDFTVIIPYLDSKDAMVRKAAVQFFWSYPQEEVIKALRQMLETEENTTIREWIEKAISKYERYKDFPSD